MRGSATLLRLGEDVCLPHAYLIHLLRRLRFDDRCFLTAAVCGLFVFLTNELRARGVVQ